MINDGIGRKETAEYWSIAGMSKLQPLPVLWALPCPHEHGGGTGVPGHRGSGSVRPLRRSAQLPVTGTKHTCDSVSWVGSAWLRLQSDIWFCSLQKEWGRCSFPLEWLAHVPHQQKWVPQGERLVIDRSAQEADGGPPPISRQPPAFPTHQL